MASRVTPHAEEEEAEVDGAEEAGGVAVSVSGYLGQSWALLYLMIVASMAHMKEKCEDSR